MQYTIFVFIVLGALLFQPITASAFFDCSDIICIINSALVFGEEHAINIAKQFPIEDIEKLFYSLDVDSRFYNVYHVLLTVIFDNDFNKYSLILIAFPELQNFEADRATQELDKAVNDFNSNHDNPFSVYASESWNIVKESAQKQTAATLSNEETLSKLEERRGLKDELTILAINVFPVIDPETKQILPLKVVAVKYADRVYFLQGSDFAKDPTRTTSLMFLEPGFMLDAKMIETSDGHWISIKEASELGYKETEIQRLIEIINTTQKLSDLDDPTKAIENYYEIQELLTKINNEKENLVN